MEKFHYVDNHAHLNFSVFDADYKEAIKRAHDAGVVVVNVGTQQDTSKRAVEIANEYADGVYAIVGLHPVHTSASHHDAAELGEGGREFTSRGEIFDYGYYKALALDSKVIGIGECGLDYYRLENDTKEIQRKVFEDQIDLSLEVGKSLMLHIRDAYEDSIEILKAKKVSKANVHFFAGSVDIARQFLDLGFTLSFTGAITYGKNYEEVLKFVPLESMLSETDCPFVAPVPYRGKRNEPAYVMEVIRKIAEVKEMPFEDVSKILRENTRRVFGI